MLPKKNRLNTKEVEDIFKKGSFLNSNNLTLKFILKKEGTSPKVSFLTPKTISKKAIVRNRLRRRGYEAIKGFFEVFPAGFVGAFVFGKKSEEFFGGGKEKKKIAKENIENEIKTILDKMRK